MSISPPAGGLGTVNPARQDAKPAVASFIWRPSRGLLAAQGSVVEELGYRHRFWLPDEPMPTDTDIVLVQGPYGSLLPLVRQLSERPASRRPVLAYWFQQSLDMLEPEPARRWLARIFSELRRDSSEAPWASRLAGSLAPGLMSSKGGRLRFLGDILWLRGHGLLDVLALSGTVYARYLEQLGVPSLLVPRGCHPSYGSVLDLPRDVAVVWMGTLRTRRRAHVVHWLREELARRGQAMQIYDGKEKGFIFGEERTRVLNRAMFVLNVYFSRPTDELSIRFYIAAANGAVVLTERMENRYPFVPGKHLVQCSVEEMPDRVMYYVDHPQEWRSISEAMLELMRTELTLKQSVASILARAEAVLNGRGQRAEAQHGTLRGTEVSGGGDERHAT